MNRNAAEQDAAGGQRQAVTPLASARGGAPAVVQQRKRPFILGAFAFALSAQALFLPIIFLFFLIMPSTSPIIYNGAEVPIGEVRLQVLGTIAGWFAFAAYLGPGLWKGTPMARHVAFATYAGLPLIFIAYRQAWHEIPWLIVCCAIVGGYLYAKANVREFFETYEAVSTPTRRGR